MVLRPEIIEPERCTYASDDPPHVAKYLLEALDPNDPFIPQQWFLCAQHLLEQLIIVGQGTHISLL